MLISRGPSILQLQKENNRERIGTSDGQWAKPARFEPIPLRFGHMSSADAAVPLGCVAAEQRFFFLSGLRAGQCGGIYPVSNLKEFRLKE